MEDIKPVVARNIAQLRTAAGMTQGQLAEKLNYSDKAVSKWERGESLPDVAVLTHIADLFGVSLDYLVRPEHPQEAPAGDKMRCKGKSLPNQNRHNRRLITAMGVVVVWLVAVLVFTIIHMTPISHWVECLIFAYAIPATIIVWLVFNSVWFNRRRNFLIISLLMWSVLIVTFLTLLVAGVNVWLLFLLGIPAQVIIFMWSKLRFRE